MIPKSQCVRVKKMKSSNVISSTDFKKLQQENDRLKKEIDFYKPRWMPKQVFFVFVYSNISFLY